MVRMGSFHQNHIATGGTTARSPNVRRSPRDVRWPDPTMIATTASTHTTAMIPLICCNCMNPVCHPDGLRAVSLCTVHAPAASVHIRTDGASRLVYDDYVRGATAPA